MKHHKKASKRVKLSLKYNVQKRQRETKRRMRKEAKRLGLNKKTKKDPGIPNSWPFKAEMLQELELKKAKKDAELLKKREDTRNDAKTAQQKEQAEKRKMLRERQAERKANRGEVIEEQQFKALRTVLTKADVILEVLDARDPLGCRCASVEAWSKENGKRLIFVLTKVDLVSPQVAIRWLQALGREGPAVAVSVEAGREGVPELLRMLGHASRTVIPGSAEAAIPSLPEAKAVGVVGYPGTGKKAFVKAMRQESRSALKWLLDSTGHLRPDAAADARTSLHLAVRGAQQKGDAWLPATATAAATAEGGPLSVVTHLLQRSQPAAVMRRFRLPAFANAAELLKAFGKDRQIKSKKGKEPGAEKVARLLLLELAKKPACFCVPQEAGAGAPLALWQPHGASESTLKALMEAHAIVLGARPDQGAPNAIELTSQGQGPVIDVESVLTVPEEPEAAAGDDDDDDNSMSGDDMSGDLEGEEGEEEEPLEGSEEESMDDEDEEE